MPVSAVGLDSAAVMQGIAGRDALQGVEQTPDLPDFSSNDYMRFKAFVKRGGGLSDPHVRAEVADICSRYPLAKISIRKASNLVFGEEYLYDCKSPFELAEIGVRQGDAVEISFRGLNGGSEALKSRLCEILGLDGVRDSTCERFLVYSLL
jgi:hypothetical protein